ncbi:unnamed protein product [Phytomonas sp. Hart1]|nr:unnamed protein product [Phytomonas sp. Hart1]|eukprot:CCW70693.1 unnamed protein product [Phytomonas sp. isolate Hart1]
MADEKFNIPFNDSSDEDCSHNLTLDIICDVEDYVHSNKRKSTNRGKGTEKQVEGMYRWITNKLVCCAQRLVGDDGELSEKFAMEKNARGEAFAVNKVLPLHNHYWGYDEYQTSPSSRSFRTASSCSLPSARNSSFSSFDNIDATRAINLHNPNLLLDLRETVLQYLRTPDEFYINIILASLKSGMFIIKGDVFELAEGNPFLIKTFLDSSHVDLEDERVKVVVQREFDRVMDVEPSEDGLKLEQSNYLFCLCNVKSTRITEKQLSLIRKSGFEFVKLIGDFPHLRKDIKPVRSWFLPIFKMTVATSVFTGWLSMLVTALFAICVLWTVFTWIMLHEKNKAYVTIIFYVWGYILTLASTMHLEEGKIKVYEKQLWSYPSNLSKIIPIIPVYECKLLYVAFCYRLTPNNHQYFVIRYDLLNGMAMQQIINGLLHAIPQLIVQVYLNSSMNNPEKGVRFVISSSFYFLLTTGICSFLLSMFSYIHQAVLSHSCDSFGFAMMSKDLKRRMLKSAMPTHIMTRILIFQTLAFMNGALATLLICIFNLHGCSYNVKTSVSIYFAIVWIEFCVLTATYIYVRFHVLYGLFCFPLILLQVFLIVILSISGPTDEYRDCPLYKVYAFDWMYPLTLLFGFLCLFCFVWMIMMFYELISGKPIKQRVLDTYFYV